jgi:hypothetical protein
MEGKPAPVVEEEFQNISGDLVEDIGMVMEEIVILEFARLVY